MRQGNGEGQCLAQTAQQKNTCKLASGEDAEVPSASAAAAALALALLLPT